MVASSRGLGELITAVGSPARLLVGLGGTATVDGGTGLREVLPRLPAPTVVACDTLVPLFDAARLYAPQKGATPAQVDELAGRLAATAELAPYAELPGAGAAGGLGAALAALGAELVPGAALVLDELGFDPSAYDLVVTGEGKIDRTTATGKAPWEVVRRCREAGVRCVVFGGVVAEPLDGVENVALSGDPARAEQDLVALGERLAGR
jgi:glycerate kinase